MNIYLQNDKGIVVATMTVFEDDSEESIAASRASLVAHYESRGLKEVDEDTYNKAIEDQTKRRDLNAQAHAKKIANKEVRKKKILEKMPELEGFI